MSVGVLTGARPAWYAAVFLVAVRPWGVDTWFDHRLLGHRLLDHRLLDDLRCPLSTILLYLVITEYWYSHTRPSIHVAPPPSQRGSPRSTLVGNRSCGGLAVFGFDYPPPLAVACPTIANDTRGVADAETGCSALHFR
ncbi:hypothetical protein GGS21DRAFT_487108 [Xylaria nigripes]|nr:hypothetical protein GGS21DRAFT_487108 [Xylaria nigripes]